MIQPAGLQRLLTWLSPAFPVGAFAWSAGLETAIAERRVTDGAALHDWIEGALAHGSLRTDAILLAHAHRGTKGFGRTDAHDQPRGTLTALADLCLALTPSAERQKELLLTGDAFVAAARAWPSDIYARLPDTCPYPIAVGAIAAAQGIGVEETLLGFLTAAVQAQVSVAIRLVPLGQTDGLAVMAALEASVTAVAKAAATAALDDIGGIAYAADIAQMRHETLEPRIFRS
jgi:urease accessory protein